MYPFATEFFVKDFSRAEFVGLVVGWLKGTSYSKLFEGPVQHELEKENAYLKAKNGEELRLIELPGGDGPEALGFRYDNPDADGRIWRTELVISKSEGLGGDSILRTRTQCIAAHLDAPLERPKKPFIIKSIIQEKKATDDGYFDIIDEPHFLEETDYYLDIALEVLNGAASLNLPIIYISFTSDRDKALSFQQIKKLAFDLGGIAHVLVEPSKSFSNSLRERANGTNVYGGTVAVYSPNTSFRRKFYIGGAIRDRFELFSWIAEYVISIRSRSPAKGWDWTELQEQALRHQIKRDKARLSVQENEALHHQEVKNLKERISELEFERAVTQEALKAPRNSEVSLSSIAGQLPEQIVEIYDGELIDRIRYFIEISLNFSDTYGLDERSKKVGEKLIDQVEPSAALGQLKRALEKATKDPKKFSKEMGSVLEEIGFIKKSDNKHIRFEPKPELVGLDSITLMKTPSDYNGLKNQKSQIENNLGIARMKS
ncbi:hypothetical protein CEW89_13465 [Celeribacter ethanolicus]|uniref:Uncharacterized protein n=1 Tax=Celeribacter ethanolicus TaxID=1758178 RepID=A0A291GEN6_9RHOB|nr:hypothetical protein [Celeribacter ethanolicus]ATG48484.1 hypothetical protein CEW89_13465 [Celeribacter ethanolicus]